MGGARPTLRGVLQLFLRSWHATTGHAATAELDAGALGWLEMIAACMPMAFLTSALSDDRLPLVTSPRVVERFDLIRLGMLSDLLRWVRESPCLGQGCGLCRFMW